MECVISTSLEVAGEAADNALPGGMQQEVYRRCDHLVRDLSGDLDQTSKFWSEFENKTKTDQ